MSRADVLAEVSAERDRQEKKFPEQTLPDSHLLATSPRRFVENRLKPHARGREKMAKARVSVRGANGTLTWQDVLDEEVAEAFAALSTRNLREELIQVAAVAVRWIEDIDRRAAAGGDPE